MVDHAEQEAAALAIRLVRYIERHDGRFFRDEDGQLQIILADRRIPITFERSNVALAGLMVNACGITTLSQKAQCAIQRLQIIAAEKAARMKLCRFSATSADGERIYIPIANGNLLCIGADCHHEVPNGDDENGMWIEHPYEEPFQYELDHPAEGLALFEQLLVETQACVCPEMKWLVGLQAGIFPYIRTLFPARLILELRGPSQLGGKTSGAQRFTLLHGLGEVKGDCSVAALNNEGDVGLLVLDNREQANFDQPLVDYCLFLSTGAQRQRSTAEGRVRTSRGRPVGIITTIEGVPKQELQARCVTVEYLIRSEHIDRASIEREICRCRHKILSALTIVLAKYLEIRGRHRNPNPRPNLSENFAAVADLLRAFEEVAEKPKGWAEQIITVWASEIGEREPEENELEHPICRAAHEGLKCRPNVNYNGRTGSLYFTNCGELLTVLQKLNLPDRSLPKTPEGLGRRLRNRRFLSFEVIDEKSRPSIPELRRTGRARLLGLFFPDDK